MAATARIEAHEVAHRSGLCCPSCMEWRLMEVEVVFVASDTLQPLGRRTGSECLACHFEDVHR